VPSLAFVLITGTAQGHAKTDDDVENRAAKSTEAQVKPAQKVSCLFVMLRESVHSYGAWVARINAGDVKSITSHLGLAQALAGNGLPNVSMRQRQDTCSIMSTRTPEMTQ